MWKVLVEGLTSPKGELCYGRGDACPGGVVLLTKLVPGAAGTSTGVAVEVGPVKRQFRTVWMWVS